jgi:dihydrofolate reductase
MGRIVVSEFLSLDGVMETPQSWHFPFVSLDMMAATTAHILEANALLLGRATYEEFAGYWPSQRHNEHGIADKLNAMPKYVVSNSLETVHWNNSRLIRGQVLEAVAELKRTITGAISVTGSATLIQALKQANLIDEYQLMVHPIIVGHGKRLFADVAGTAQLKLTASRTFQSGVIELTYQSLTA